MARWQQVKIGDVCVVERGGSPRPIEKFITDDKNGINWIKIGDTTESMYITKTAQKIIPEGAKKSRFVQSGDFLLSNSMSFGRPYILSIDGCIHDGWLVLRDKDNLFDKHFLYYCLSAPVTYAKFKSMAVGGVVNNLNSEMVRNVEIPLPPLEEQRRIATVLDKVSDLIAKRRAQLDKLDLLVKARFVEIFGQYIGKNEQTLNAICNFIDYRGKTPEKSESGIPLITAKNIKQNLFCINPQEFIPTENYDTVMTRGIPQVNDVLFTTEAPLGNVCRIPDIYDKFCVGQRIITMQPHKDTITSEYLEYALISKEFQDKMWQKSSGSTVKGIRSKLLEQLTIPVPPFDQQQQFSKIVVNLEHSKFIINCSLKKLETLRKAIMQQYFG